MTRVYVIAEVGVNHNGDMDLACQLIEVAAKTGADAVKFQTFMADALVCGDAPKAQYQKRVASGDQSQREMLKNLELSAENHLFLFEQCGRVGIEFLSTAFGLDSLDLLTDRLGLKKLKIPSGEITNPRLLLHAARSGLPIILSCGMATLAEIESALAVLTYGYLHPGIFPSSLDVLLVNYATAKAQHVLKDKVTLLQCTTEYPTPAENVNLLGMDTLRSAFGLRVGLSDHSKGIAIAIAAAARGAVVIEKHFTLDRKLPGPDHQASLEPGELRAMVEGIRQVERAMGDGRRVPRGSEWENRDIVRCSLVASRSIATGERFSLENLTSKRPGHGLSGMFLWALLGQPADRNYQRDERIKLWNDPSS